MFVVVLLFLTVVLSACGPATDEIIGNTVSGDYVSEALDVKVVGSSIGAGITWLICSVGAGIGIGLLVNWLRSQNRMRTDKAPLGPAVLFGILTTILIFGLAAAWASYTKVNPGEVGVVLRQGEPKGTLNRGPHFIAPFLDEVVLFPTREFTFITMDKPIERGSEQYRTFNMEIRTSNGVIGNVPFLVQAQVDPTKAEYLYDRYGTLENAIVQLIKSSTLSLVRDVVRDKTATEIATDIDKYNDDIEIELRKIMEPKGLILINFSFRKPDLGPWEIERNDAVVAEQTIEKNKQLALAAKEVKEGENYTAIIDAQIARETAKGTADSAITKAEGQAKVVKINADAEAYSVITRAQAEAEANLLVAESLTQDLIDYRKWLIWDGKFPSTYLQGSDTGLLLELPTQ